MPGEPLILEVRLRYKGQVLVNWESPLQPGMADPEIDLCCAPPVCDGQELELIGIRPWWVKPPEWIDTAADARNTDN